MNNRIAAGLVLGLLNVLAACDAVGPFGRACTDELRPSLRIAVSDSATAEPLTGHGVRVVTTTRTFVDTLAVDQAGVAALGKERSGRYRVQVDAPGYHTWVREGINVTRDECHVITVDVKARLQSQ